MSKAKEAIEDFENIVEEFIINGSTYQYDFLKLCNAQTAAAMECLTWCRQVSNKIPDNFEELVVARYPFWKAKIMSYLLVEVKNGKPQPFDIDECYKIEQGILAMPSMEGERDNEIIINNIIESFFLRRGSYNELLRFALRGEKQSLTQTEEILAVAEAMEKIMNANKLLQENMPVSKEPLKEANSTNE